MSDKEIFAKAVRRAKISGIEEFDRYGVIVFLENEIDMYRDKIKKLLDEKEELKSRLNTIYGVTQLEAVQESSPGEIIKALSDNGFNNISINIYKTKEENNDD